ncbi:MAG: DUF6788 family protein [bacterium]
MSTKREQIELYRRELMRQLSKLGPWIEGTLVFTVRTCGKKSCACMGQGPKHPVMYITGKQKGKTVSLYIPRKLESEVKVWVENYRRVKELIRKISEVQKEIVRLRGE